MTINSVSTIASTPFAGLATQTFNVPTTGLYSMQVNATIPWQLESSVAAVPNVQTVTTVADSAGSLNSTWFKFYTAGNAYGYYVWYNINSAGVDPAPAGLTGIAVAGATSATANTLATATRTAITAAVATTLVVVTGATNAIILTNVQGGSVTAAADGTAATGFGFSTGTAGSFGTSSGLVITLKKNSTVLATLSQPTPSQASMGGALQTQATAGDTLTMVTSSLSAVDTAPNAVRGVLNIFAGPL